MQSISLSGPEIYQALPKAFAKGADEVTRLFHEEAVIEYPYASSLGTPGLLNKEGLHKYLAGALPDMPDLTFSDTRVYRVDGREVYWAEAFGQCTIRSTGLLYQQKYLMHFALKEGLFSYYREYWDLLAIKAAFGQEADLKRTFR